MYTSIHFGLMKSYHGVKSSHRNGVDEVQATDGGTNPHRAAISIFTTHTCPQWTVCECVDGTLRPSSSGLLAPGHTSCCDPLVTSALSEGTNPAEATTASSVYTFLRGWYYSWTSHGTSPCRLLTSGNFLLERFVLGIFLFPGEAATGLEVERSVLVGEFPIPRRWGFPILLNPACTVSRFTRCNWVACVYRCAATVCEMNRLIGQGV